MEMTALEQHLVSVYDTSGVLVLAVLVALVVGVGHSLAPGHGKAITAAYLVAERARVRDAVLLGSVVAAMHTVSVTMLALVWVAMAVTASFATDVVTGWLQVVAAAAVVGIGLVLVRRRWRHGSSHHHHHLADVPTTSRGMAVALGASGGLLPAPAAFLVLVSGLLSGRVVYAFVLVGAFALGMALTLSAVGIATLRGRDLLHRHQRPGGVLTGVLHRLPALGAVGVLAGGLVYLGVSIRALAL